MKIIETDHIKCEKCGTLPGGLAYTMGNREAMDEIAIRHTRATGHQTSVFRQFWLAKAEEE